MAEPADDPVQAVAAALTTGYNDEVVAARAIAAYTEWMARTGYAPPHMEAVVAEVEFTDSGVWVEITPEETGRLYRLRPAVSPEEPT